MGVPLCEKGHAALGISFKGSLKCRNEPLLILKKGSHDCLLQNDAAPTFLDNESATTRSNEIALANYEMH